MDAPKQKHATKNSFIKTEPTLSEESSANSAPDEKNLSCSDRAEESNQSPDPDRLGDAAGDKFAVVLVGVTGQRRSRSKVLRNKIKVENIAEGLIACPHPICKKEKLALSWARTGAT
ncbi:expressed unknown protein [Seminavis robusta]|uniref:Uncharacterized protein n=1 Tax=Seminavis robusta TaxID=568900 RepID=A0A9N8DD52_9STRA|nr:expressed unknown protein [Seminavis robusta]|eukprot:Sro35_g022530.1 n/a (117) ;mRNA; f:120403-120753